MDTALKYCWRCKTEKLITDFCRNGKDNVCRICRYELNSEWSKNHRDTQRPKRTEYMRQYRKRKEEEAAAKDNADK